MVLKVDADTTNGILPEETLAMIAHNFQHLIKENFRRNGGQEEMQTTPTEEIRILNA